MKLQLHFYFLVLSFFLMGFMAQGQDGKATPFTFKSLNLDLGISSPKDSSFDADIFTGADGSIYLNNRFFISAGYKRSWSALILDMARPEDNENVLWQDYSITIGKELVVIPKVMHFDPEIGVSVLEQVIGKSEAVSFALRAKGRLLFSLSENYALGVYGGYTISRFTDLREIGISLAIKVF